MKTIQKLTACLALFILFNCSITADIYAQKTDKCKHTNLNTIDLGCVKKQVSLQAAQKKGLLIQSKKFVFYMNRMQNNLLFVSNRLTISKGDFNII